MSSQVTRILRLTREVYGEDKSVRLQPEPHKIQPRDYELHIRKRNPVRYEEFSWKLMCKGTLDYIEQELKKRAEI